MNKFIISIFSIVVLTANADHSSFRADINKVLGGTKENLNIAIVVSNPVNKNIVYSKNISRHFPPASTLKLITAYCALQSLGSNYQYQTNLYATQYPNNPILIGNVYLKFSGDPSLSLTDIDALVKVLAQQGITKVWGKLIIDDNNQDRQNWPSGAVKDDTKFCFAAPVSSIIIDKNCINASANIASNQVIINTDKYTDVTIHNFLQFTSENKDNAELIAKENNEYVLTGQIHHSFPLKIAVQDNRLYSQQIIARVLSENNITVSQGIDFGITPPAAVLIGNHVSEKLSMLITLMLKNSDNIIANALFRTLRVQDSIQDDAWTQGSAKIKNILSATIGDMNNDLVIKDGAGLSIYNLLTPYHLIRLLNKIYTTDHYYFFMHALPKGGVDGTLQNRFNHKKINVLAKTGTATSISSLAGYIQTRKKHNLSFVIMISNGSHKSEKYKKLEDDICYLIYEKL